MQPRMSNYFLPEVQFSIMLPLYFYLSQRQRTQDFTMRYKDFNSPFLLTPGFHPSRLLSIISIRKLLKRYYYTINGKHLECSKSIFLFFQVGTKPADNLSEVRIVPTDLLDTCYLYSCQSVFCVPTLLMRI